jgi:hypothetical protein
MRRSTGDRRIAMSIDRAATTAPPTTPQRSRREHFGDATKAGMGVGDFGAINGLIGGAIFGAGLTAIVASSMKLGVGAHLQLYPGFRINPFP